MFTDDEKKLLQFLLKKELKQFTKEEGEITEPSAPFLAVEKEYETALKKVLEKLK